MNDTGSPIAKLYADGGVIERNPSPIGGTWAYCHVNSDNTRIHEASGSVTPADCGVARVSNNMTEFLALLYGLESLPAGWVGKVFTDSGVTLMRFESPNTIAMNGIPDALVERLKAVRAKLGELTFHLLGGHPTKQELKDGFRRKDGKPVSEHNVRCDWLCCEQAKAVMKQQQAA